MSHGGVARGPRLWVYFTAHDRATKVGHRLAARTYVAWVQRIPPAFVRCQPSGDFVRLVDVACGHRELSDSALGKVLGDRLNVKGERGARTGFDLVKLAGRDRGGLIPHALPVPLAEGATGCECQVGKNALGGD